MIKRKPHSAKRAFTLVELLLGMTIMSLVIYSVFAMLDIATKAYQKGIQSMEIRQSARIGLRRVAEELRYSLNGNAFWKPQQDIKNVSVEHLMMMFPVGLVKEEEQGAIVFKGDNNSCVFSRKVYQLGQNPPFDLQECQIQVNRETNQLVLTVVRSLLKVKQMSWWYTTQFQLPIRAIIVPEGTRRSRFRILDPGVAIDAPPLEYFIGDYGMINRHYLICDYVKEVHFRYAEDGSFSSQWDSQQIKQEYRISPQSPNFMGESDVLLYEKGPPQVVEIRLELINGESLITSTDIPAGSLGNYTAAPLNSINPVSPPPTGPTGESPSAIPNLPGVPNLRR